VKRILEVKKKIGTLSKKETNPFFKSKYLDLNSLLDAVEPLLWEQGLILMQPILDGKVISSINDSESGQCLVASELELPAITDPQKLGSCITYFRRYTLKSLLAISEEDDDGNSASNPARKTLIVNSKEFQNGLTKKKSLEEMKKYYFITEQVAVEYQKQLK
jgi:hypothetical protein